MKSETNGADVLEVKKEITKKRISITETKATVKKLGDETVAIIPTDWEMMFIGKLLQISNKGITRSSNIIAAYKRSYEGIDETVEKRLLAYQYNFVETFDSEKKAVIKLAENHPLWKRLSGIRGLTAYQVALLMAYIKDISRFDTPSKLCLYAGMGCINGMAVTKANLNKIRQFYLESGKNETVDAEKLTEGDVVYFENEMVDVKSVETTESFVNIEFKNGSFTQYLKDTQVVRIKDFKGFNTELSGRMFVITECLIRSKGYFYDYYTKLRVRLQERAMNAGECELGTVGQFKGKWMMKGKKNQSLIMFSHKGAMRRCARMLLHFLHTEWRLEKKLSTRIPYPIEYLGHDKLVTLDEVKAYDAALKNKNDGDDLELPVE